MKSKRGFPEAARPAALAALRRFNATRWKYPKCGAKRKSDGGPCQNLARENGRCRIHGGLTPKGAEWHVSQLPDGRSLNWQKKLDRKLRKRNSDKKRKVSRVAAMSPAEREVYYRWHRFRTPGSAAERARRRREREQAKEMRATIESGGPVKDTPELAMLRDQIENLERALASIEAGKGIGVFG